jgi:transposase InsO family protein
MTDFSPGPKLNLQGKAITTQLCLILDDHSRLITFGAYYRAADTSAFHHSLKEAVERRGIPYKLYTDLGRPFTNKHTQIVCANLGIRLLHAKPYAAWSKGKIERCFHSLQQGFETTLKLPENRVESLEELNEKLNRWIQSVYHLRTHSSTAMSPALRFAQAAGTLRELDDGDLSLRALQVELRFDPFSMKRIEVYHRNRACGLARLANLHLNSQLEGSRHYDR